LTLHNLQIHINFLSKCKFSGAWSLRDLIRSASACYWWGCRSCGMDSSTLVWDLTDET